VTERAEKLHNETMLLNHDRHQLEKKLHEAKEEPNKLRKQLRAANMESTGQAQKVTRLTTDVESVQKSLDEANNEIARLKLIVHQNEADIDLQKRKTLKVLEAAGLPSDFPSASSVPIGSARIGSPTSLRGTPDSLPDPSAAEPDPPAAKPDSSAAQPELVAEVGAPEHVEATPIEDKDLMSVGAFSSLASIEEKKPVRHHRVSILTGPEAEETVEIAAISASGELPVVDDTPALDQDVALDAAPALDNATEPVQATMMPKKAVSRPRPQRRDDSEIDVDDHCVFGSDPELPEVKSGPREDSPHEGGPVEPESKPESEPETPRSTSGADPSPPSAKLRKSLSKLKTTKLLGGDSSPRRASGQPATPRKSFSRKSVSHAFSQSSLEEKADTAQKEEKGDEPDVHVRAGSKSDGNPREGSKSDANVRPGSKSDADSAVGDTARRGSTEAGVTDSTISRQPSLQKAKTGGVAAHTSSAGASIPKIMHQRLVTAAVDRERRRWARLLPRTRSEGAAPRMIHSRRAETGKTPKFLEDVLSAAEEEAHTQRYHTLFETLGGGRHAKGTDDEEAAG
jgi:hypothetical protein